MTASAQDYVTTVYNSQERPKTQYPAQLCSYLVKTFNIPKSAKLLEVGCGRGDFLIEFAKLGLHCQGVDLSENAQKILAESGISVALANADEDELPFGDNTFDVIYSKSFLEHLHHPDRYLREALRVLKPGGICLSLVPDWESNYKIYFDDFTHRTPFTQVALHDIYKMCGFVNVAVRRFKQLPVTWNNPFVDLVSSLVAPFVPIRTQNKFFRWSRELMLLGVATKPKS